MNFHRTFSSEQVTYRMDATLNALNAAQRAAVTSSANVLQVLAPPGSGKTKTLTTRVAHLLSHNGYSPWNVICCTFTIKASREMRERLRVLIGSQLESKLILGTFHSICRRYLVTYGYLIGISKDFGIADSSDTLAILKRIIKRLDLNLDAKAARSKISHRKARGLSEDELLKPVKKTLEKQELATIYQEYQRALSTSNLLDYDDLLIRCTDLLRAHPHCVSNVQALLIDEFQDTNVVQYELMKLLAWKNNRITIVGDPDQSIYGFRSAESENLRRMKAYYPDTIVINLEANYRSSSAVLRLAQDVIEQDTNRPQKRLKSTHCHGTMPVLRRLPSAFDEASWLVSEIRRAMAMAGNLLGYSDFAILLRAAHLSRLIELELGKAGMPYRMVGGNRFFEREEIRLLLDYLRTISQPNNDAALSAIINVPSRKIGEETIKELLRVGQQKSLSLWAVIQRVTRGDLALQKNLSKPAEQELSKLVRMIIDARQRLPEMIPDNAPRELLALIITKLSFKEFLESKHVNDHENRWANVEELMAQAGDMAKQRTLSTDTELDEELPEIEGLEQQKLEGSEEVLARFLASITLSAGLQPAEDETQEQCITISTIHAAKGLEWPVVFIPAVYEGSIPHSRADDTDEERRLLYVAMTRAQALLYLSVPLCQSKDDAKTTLSQFLPEALCRCFWELGPEFTDNAVADIAKILRRPQPSQEQLIGGMHKILASDTSIKDDVWPADGTSRPFKHWNHDAAQPGRTHTGFRSVSLLPAKDGSHQEITAPNSGPAVSAGFTTAGHHLRLNPELREPSNPISSSGTGQTRTMKKTAETGCKRSKAGPGQASLSAFFAHGSFKSAVPSLTAPKTNAAGYGHDTSQPTLPESPHKSNERQIPQDLISHKIGGITMTQKRPRPVLEKTASPQKNRYHCFSSSPPREGPPTKKLDSSLKQENDVMTGNDISSHDTRITGIQVSSESYKGYSSTAYRPAATNHITSMAMVQQNATGRKTYGARRSLHNGWDSRKHK